MNSQPDLPNVQPSSLEVSGHDLDAVLTDLARRGASVSRMATVTGHNSRWLLSLYWSQPTPSAGQARTRHVQPSAVLTLETGGDAATGQPEGKATAGNAVRNLLFAEIGAGRATFHLARNHNQI